MFLLHSRDSLLSKLFTTISDSVSLYDSECRVEIDPAILAQALKRGTPENEKKLAYFLGLFVDAEVYNYALLFALVLRYT